MIVLSFGAWWEGFSVFAKIYWMIAIPASIIFLIQLILSFFQHKTEELIVDKTGNYRVLNESEIAFQLINFRNIIGFFTGFGWSGLACIDSDLTIFLTLIISTICGAIVMVTMAVFFYFMSKLLKTVEEDL